MFRKTLVAVAASFVLVVAPLAEAQFTELANKLPAGTNMVVLVRPEKLKEGSDLVPEDLRRESPIYMGSLAFLVPDANAVILGQQFDIELMIPMQSTSLLSLDKQTSLSEIVRRTGGIADRFGGIDGLVLPGDAYLLQLAPNLVAGTAPANRQAVVRWLREMNSSQKSLSPYLVDVLEKAEKNDSPLTFAIDLEGAVTSRQVRELLKNLPVARSAAEIEVLAPVLADVRGATLTLDVDGKEFHGKLAIELGSDLLFPPEAGKKLLLETLGVRGATINELSDWSVAVSGRQMILEGSLTSSGIQRIASIINRPPALTRDKSATDLEEKDRALISSRKYWNQIQELLVDLKREPKKSSGYSLGQVAMWMDSYARRIDQTSVAYVDPELAAYGASIADSLRQASYAIKEGNARGRIQQMNTPMQYDYYPWEQIYGYTYRWDYFGSGYVPYGNYGVDVVPNVTAYYRARSRARSTERIAGMSRANAIMDTVNKLSGEIKNKMEQKYNSQF